MSLLSFEGCECLGLTQWLWQTVSLTIFGTKMANSLKLYEVHSFSTSSNSCQCTTVLNADVPNCYITL